jgi:hypothetical protein
MSISNVSYLANGYAQPSAQRIDNLTTTVYVATAPFGTLDSAPTWSIKRLTFSGTLVITEWANGNDSNANIWTNRALLSYS